ncbi:TldD/PmbA family protein [Lentisphaerota bacterium WC36G]|nr:TldD/PmbA family protein [Lentisphaerae bacterium WC36]
MENNSNTIQKYRSELLNVINYAKKNGADAVKICFTYNENFDIGFEAGKFKGVETSERISYSITVMKNHKLVTVAGNRIDGIKKLVDNALIMVEHGSKCYFSEWGGAVPFNGEVKTYSKTVEELSVDAMVDGCQQIINGIKSYENDLYTASSATKVIGRTLLLTSSGLNFEEMHTYWSMNGYAQRTVGTDMLNSYAGRSWGEVTDEFFNPQVIIEEVVRDLEYGKNIAKLPSGEYPAFLTAGATNKLLWGPLSIGIKGRLIEKGGSPLKGKLNEKILAESITIEDNPFIDYSIGSDLIDADGIVTERKNIIEDGVLKNFVYDLDSAALGNVRPTGNSGGECHNVVISPGMIPKDDLISNIEKGVYLHNFIGLGQGNFANGDFSCNVALGYVVENGEIVGRLKDTMVSGNSYELFKNNVLVSSDRDWSDMIPRMLIDKITVTS